MDDLRTSVNVAIDSGIVGFVAGFTLGSLDALLRQDPKLGAEIALASGAGTMEATLAPSKGAIASAPYALIGSVTASLGYRAGSRAVSRLRTAYENRSNRSLD